MGYYDQVLEHHGIKGQKWGVRRFEKAGGGLTAAGKARYKTDSNGNYQKLSKEEQRARKDAVTKWGTQSNQPSSARSSFLAGTYAGLRISTGKDPKLIGKALDKSNDADEKRWKAAKKARSNMSDEEIKETEKLVKKERAKKAAIIGGVAVGTALAAYGGYKVYQLNKKANEGLSKEYHGASVSKFLAANMHEFETNLNYNSGKFDKAKEHFNAAAQAKEAGKILQEKAQSKDYSIKDKVDYLKNGIVTSENRVNKALTYNKDGSFTNYALNKQGIKTVQPRMNGLTYNDYNAILQKSLNTMKSMTTFDASRHAVTGNDLVMDLLKKNSAVLGV